jgi:hypothetical protein
VYLFDDSTPTEIKQAKENARLTEKLIAFCIDNWDNEFMHDVQDNLQGMRPVLMGMKE